ncbi:hypothetical protein LCGC14_2656200, partial [marine sediment metagenome]
MEDTTFNSQENLLEQTDFKMELHPIGKTKIFSALSKFQGKSTHPKKDTLVSFNFQGRTTKYLYATLDACISENQELLAECGLAITQFPIVKDGRVGLTTILSHSDGEFIQSYYSMKADNEKAQTVGSALTYLRRYSYCAAVGVAAEMDDDGENADAIKKDGDKASGEKSQQQKPTQQQQTNGEKKQLGFAEKRTLTKNDINDRLKDKCKTVPQLENLWVLLTKSQQENKETIGWFSMRKAQIVNELKELKKIVEKEPEKTNNEKAAEMFSPEEKPDAMKFINAIRLIKTQENLNEFYKMYKDKILG